MLPSVQCVPSVNSLFPAKEALKQKPCSHGVWLGKPRVARGSYLWTVVGGIPTNGAAPTASSLPRVSSKMYYLFAALKLHLGGKRFVIDADTECEVHMWLRHQSEDLYATGIGNGK
ncbi:hypothetical protein AVEN_24797-1 [Araneus ventricosus]|uniref:Uncharacterized protein n=1 Tax=Araneus ventricosus TaxID=182803 RepID=A0A4Y2BUH3_ARAVE|nr:hypothetical protein AVEN_24797-1 [Araneus ventricosus]